MTPPGDIKPLDRQLGHLLMCDCGAVATHTSQVSIYTGSVTETAHRLIERYNLCPSCTLDELYIRGDISYRDSAYIKEVYL